MISGIADKVRGAFGVRSLSQDITSGSSSDTGETMVMASKIEDRIPQSVGSNIVGVVHCGRDNIDEVPIEKSTVIVQNPRRRLSKKSCSMDVDIAENDILSLDTEDTIFTVIGGLMEGQDDSENVNGYHRKDSVNETAEIFAKMGSGRRRSSVLRDKELELAAADLGDRMI